jgi:hypothetical protein
MSAALPGDVMALDTYWDELSPYLDGVYLSFDTRVGEKVLCEAFPGATLDRLRALKAKYDPDQVFGDNFPISPASTPGIPHLSTS